MAICISLTNKMNKQGINEYEVVKAYKRIIRSHGLNAYYDNYINEWVLVW